MKFLIAFLIAWFTAAGTLFAEDPTRVFHDPTNNDLYRIQSEVKTCSDGSDRQLSRTGDLDDRIWE
jgi:hypothetical protein